MNGLKGCHAHRFFGNCPQLPKETVASHEYHGTRDQRLVVCRNNQGAGANLKFISQAQREQMHGDIFQPEHGGIISEGRDPMGKNSG